MKRFKFAAIIAAGAALALSPAQVSAQAASPAKIGIQLRGHPEGAEVVAVVPGGTAETMGVKVGDIVMELNGKPISPQVVQEYSQKTNVGDQVNMKVKRADAVVDLTGKALAATPQP